jgi:putative membrane protein
MAAHAQESGIGHPPPDSNALAWERTWLAHERTSMAWVRTGASLITLGFSLYKFFAYLRESEPNAPRLQLLGPRTFGMMMIGVGVVSLAMAAIQHRVTLRRVRAYYAPPASLSSVLTMLLAVLGILAFVAALLRE